MINADCPAFANELTRSCLKYELTLEPLDGLYLERGNERQPIGGTAKSHACYSDGLTLANRFRT
jgi:hypothetical protein